MKLRTFHIMLLLLMVWSVSFSQQYTQFSTRNGLPSNHVYRITQDHLGFIWLATDKGLVKYNGRDFRVFDTADGLPVNDIWNFCITPDNRLWFFSKAERLGYIENDKVHTFPAQSDDPVLVPRGVFRYGNNILVGSGKYVYYLADDAYWKPIGTRGNSLTPWTPLEEIEKLPEEVKDFAMTIFSLKETRIDERDSVPWGTADFHNRHASDSIFYWYGFNFLLVQKMEEIITVKDLRKEIDKEDIKTVRIHELNGETQLSGLDFWASLDKEYNITEVVNLPEELEAHSAVRDRTGNLWIATPGNGMYKLPEIKRGINYAFPGKKVREISDVNGDIIITVQGDGFYSYMPESKTFAPKWQTDGFVFGAVGVDTLNKGFYILNSGIRIETGNVSVQRDQIDGIARDFTFWNDHLYTYRAAGVTKLDPESFSEINTYLHEAVMAFEPTEEFLLLGTSSGLMTLDRDDNISPLTGHVEFKHPVLDIEKISDSLMVVMTDGFGAYITDLKEITPLPESDYLSIPKGQVYKDQIWLATHKGVLQYAKDGTSYRLEQVWDENDGLPLRNTNTVWVNDENLLVGTDNGISIHNLDKKSESHLLDIYVQDAKFNNAEITGESASVRFTPNNSMSFLVSAIDFSENTSEFSYEYKLEPNQTNWTRTSSETLSFSDLSPEDYTLRVRSQGVENTYGFSVLPLWWQRTISKVTFVLLAITLIGLLLRYQRKREVARKTMRLETQKKLTEFELYALRSQMNPHFVFNSLGAIQYYINNNDFKTSETYLVKFSRLVRQFFELSKEKEIPLSEEIKLLTNYLDIEKLRFKEKLNYSVTLSEDIDPKKFKVPTMLLQPVVENAVNHGVFNKVENGTIDILFSTNGHGGIRVDIEDDGVGYVNTQQKNKGKVKSSNVLQERLYFLNQSGNWDITYSREELHPDRDDRGNRSTFIIKRNS